MSGAEAAWNERWGVTGVCGRRRYCSLLVDRRCLIFLYTGWRRGSISILTSISRLCFAARWFSRVACAGGTLAGTCLAFSLNRLSAAAVCCLLSFLTVYWIIGGITICPAGLPNQRRAGVRQYSACIRRGTPSRRARSSRCVCAHTLAPVCNIDVWFARRGTGSACDITTRETLPSISFLLVPRRNAGRQRHSGVARLGALPLPFCRTAAVCGGRAAGRRRMDSGVCVTLPANLASLCFMGCGVRFSFLPVPAMPDRRPSAIYSLYQVTFFALRYRLHHGGVSACGAWRDSLR